MPRSFLDAADLAALRRAGLEGGPAALALACLLEGGVAEFDPEEPEWADRDRVLVDPALPLHAVAAVLDRAGYHADDGRMGQGPGRVLAEALRAARASKAAGDVYRVFAVLDGASLAQGAVWEALLQAAADALTPLTLLVLAPTPASAPAPTTSNLETSAHIRAGVSRLEVGDVLRAAGWRVEEASAEAAEILGGLDRLLAPSSPGSGASGPGALVLRSR